MLFHSPLFLFYFLPSLILFYYIGPKYFRNSILLTGSLLFYAWSEVFYSIILLTLIVFSYLFGIAIDYFKNKPSLSLGLTSFGIILNLGILGFFKYWTFLSSEIDHFLGWKLTKSTVMIHLPLGISFFTFQSISYIIDIHRKYFPAQKNLFHLALFISFFPQLIAGPIVRYREVSNQIIFRDHTSLQFLSGINLFIIGLAKKVLVAGPLSIFVDDLFALDSDNLSTTTSWLGAICFSIQVYFDFSGYSDMAMGLARLFGFQLPENFNYPFISRSISEFWNRWHITLSNWFRDYLFYAMGVRVKGLRLVIQLFVVFLAVGLWHGANWNFLIFGFYHGAFIVAERMGAMSFIKSWPRWIQHFYVLVMVCFGMIIFRSNDLDQNLTIWNHMLSLNIEFISDYQTARWFTFEFLTAFFIGLSLSMPIFPIIKTKLLSIFHSSSIWFLIFTQAGYFLLLSLSLLKVSSGTHQSFIYFRF